ncbi:hypothetical protein D3C76_708840 [compost metagenome]
MPELNALPARIAAPWPLTSISGPVNATFVFPPRVRACMPKEPMPLPSPDPASECVMIVPPELTSTVPVGDWVDA